MAKAKTSCHSVCPPVTRQLPSSSSHDHQITKITSDIKSCEFLPDNYSGTIRKDRTKDSGGVMLATRKDLDVVEIDLCENTAECVWAKISIWGQDPILAGCFYRTNSEHTINQMEELEKTLNHVQETHNPNGKYTIMLGGDFNVPYIDWETLAILPSCNSWGMYEKLLDVIDENELQQFQLEPTRNDATLDLFFTNKPSLIKNITVIPGISDHDTVVVDTALTITPNVKLPRKIQQWSKTDWDKVKEEVTTYRDTYFHKARNHSVDENYKSFQDFIMGIINKYVPWMESDVNGWHSMATRGLYETMEEQNNYVNCNSDYICINSATRVYPSTKMGPIESLLYYVLANAMVIAAVLLVTCIDNWRSPLLCLQTQDPSRSPVSSILNFLLPRTNPGYVSNVITSYLSMWMRYFTKWSCVVSAYLKSRDRHWK